MSNNLVGKLLYNPEFDPLPRLIIAITKKSKMIRFFDDEYSDGWDFESIKDAAKHSYSSYEEINEKFGTKFGR